MSDLLSRLQASLGSTYRIERELGGGGMSRVFLADEGRLGRRVVIKVLPPETSAGVHADRFEREIQVAASLQHPHLVPLLTAGSAGDLLYYVMPYIDGESLATRIGREGALPVADAVRIVRDVSEALAYAHARGVVHRDIKPDNILLSERHALVTDFGVAKAVGAAAAALPGTALTGIGMALGTPAYMAPEQASADPNIDHRADIYALGAVAYELLSGRTPFLTGTAHAMLAAHVAAAPDPVAMHRPAIPAELAALVMRCLEKHPADRWQSAAELLGRLDALTTPSGGSTPVATPSVAASRRSAETAYRRAHPVRVAGFFVVAAAGVTGLAFLATREFGLPDWVWVLALLCMLAGLPIMLYTSRLERDRARQRTTGGLPDPEPAHQRFFTWRRAIAGGMVALGALTVLAGGYAVSRAMGIGPARTLLSSGALEGGDRLVLADFTARSLDSNLAVTVTEALRVDLGQSRAVRLVDPSAVSSALTRMGKDAGAALDENVAREVALREGAKAILLGEIAALPAGYVLTARLVRADSGTTLLPVRVTAASDGELIPAVNRLSAELRARIGESLSAIRASEPLEQVTTASLPALQLYSRARRGFDRGDFEASRDLLLRAVTLDTSFATAWRGLSATYFNLGSRGRLQADAARAAFRHRDRLPPLERHLAEAAYYQFANRIPDSAIVAYHAALDIRPEDPTAVNNLALVLNGQGRFAEAEKILRGGLTSSARSMSIVVNLQYALIAQSKWAASDTLGVFAERHYPDHPYTLGRPVDVALARRDLVAAERAIADPRVAAQTAVNVVGRVRQQRAQIKEMRGQLRALEEQADSVVRLAVEGGNRRAAARWSLTPVSLYARQRNRPAAARAALKRTLALPIWRDLPEAMQPLGPLSEAYALVGDADRVRRLRRAGAAQRGSETTIRPPQEARWDALEAEAKGRWREAAAAYSRAAALSKGCKPCGTFHAAHAWDRAGQADSAEAYYRQGVDTPASDDGAEDATFYPLALRRLGELADARGDRASALDFYQRFVDLWRDADADLQPQVTAARQRIAALTAEPRPITP